MLYTRKGDDGTSGLLGTKERFAKDSPIYDALGSVDELSSLLGVLRARPNPLRAFSAPEEILAVQQCLFIVQAELAGADKKLAQGHIEALEAAIERAEAPVGNPHSFVVPGTTEDSALFDYARTVARRTERIVISAKSQKELSPETYAYLNRLSSFLYALARLAAFESGEQEPKPSY